MDTTQIQQFVTRLYDSIAPLAVSFAGKLVGAIALWVIGRIIISAVRGMVRRTSERRNLDATLVRYLDSILGVGLQILLFIAILSVFGIETASFAGVLAAVGVAIGMAWSGLLSNFAAGVFLIVLAPFRVGNHILVAGVDGVVQEIGLFVTAINTADNVRVYVGNAKIFSDTITNFTTNPSRRVDISAQLAGSVNVPDAIRRLKARIATLPHVMKDPAPQIEINTFSAYGPVLLVRAFTHDATYWDVFFAMNDMVADEFTKAGYPGVSSTHYVRQLQ